MNNTTQEELPPLYDMVKAMQEAEAIVKAKFLFKRFIDGTPLSNDIAVWMAEYARQCVAPRDQRIAKLKAENARDKRDAKRWRQLAKCKLFDEKTLTEEIDSVISAIAAGKEKG